MSTYIHGFGTPGMFILSRHIEFEISVLFTMQECLSNSYILDGSSGERIMVEIDLGLVS